MFVVLQLQYAGPVLSGFLKKPTLQLHQLADEQDELDRGDRVLGQPRRVQPQRVLGEPRLLLPLRSRLRPSLLLALPLSDLHQRHLSPRF